MNKWLLQCNSQVLPDNNWRCEQFILFIHVRSVRPSYIADGGTVFRILVNLGLKSVGADYSQKAIDAELDFIEAFYGAHVGVNSGVAVLLPRLEQALQSCLACSSAVHGNPLVPLSSPQPELTVSGLPKRRRQHRLQSLRLLRHILRHPLLHPPLRPSRRCLRSRPGETLPREGDCELTERRPALCTGRRGHTVRAQFDVSVRLQRFLRGCGV